MKKNYWTGEFYCDELDEHAMRKLLIGRRVVKVDEGNLSLTLDNGTVLKVDPNHGCCCGAGCYYLDHLEAVNNVITDVEAANDYDEERDHPTAYRIYVYANGIRHELLRVVGDDGNGYYGTGYRLIVKAVKR